MLAWMRREEKRVPNITYYTYFHLSLSFEKLALKDSDVPPPVGPELRGEQMNNRGRSPGHAPSLSRNILHCGGSQASGVRVFLRVLAGCGDGGGDHRAPLE